MAPLALRTADRCNLFITVAARFAVAAPKEPSAETSPAQHRVRAVDQLRVPDGQLGAAEQNMSGGFDSLHEAVIHVADLV